jgi:peptidoglycan hydrolase-like protein with peptidoglycan-binding domain
MTDLDDRSLDIAERLERRSASITVGLGSLGAVQRRARQRSQHRVAMVGAAGVLVAAGAVAARLRPGDAAQPSTSIAPAPTTTVAPIPGATPTLQKGDHGSDVVRLQQQLLRLGIFPGPTDGNFSTLTEQAVWAAEGWLLDRPVGRQTGAVDATLWSALDGSAPAPRRSGSGTHVEVDLPTQVLVVWTDDKAALVTHVSTGTGKQWCGIQTVDVDIVGRPTSPTTNAVCSIATTPGGVFHVYRSLPGSHNTALGRVTDALFFNYTINLAGAIDVPRGPSSHGGVKVPLAVQQHLIDLVHVGDKVLVWNGSTEPESVSRKDAFPVIPYPGPNVTTTTVG